MYEIGRITMLELLRETCRLVEGCSGMHVKTQSQILASAGNYEIRKFGLGVIAEFRGSVENWEFTNYLKDWKDFTELCRIFQITGLVRISPI
jgi:hypothetical protein